MLPTPTDNGARLAAILPTALATLAQGQDLDPQNLLHEALGMQSTEPCAPASLPRVRSIVLLVVDGLGHANLRAASGHARTLSKLPARRIETVIPSTTAAALTSLTTGRLPGEHGLIGYRIRHPQLGVLTTLTDWDDIDHPQQWQRSSPLFGMAAGIGVRAVAVGRPAHAGGGLTSAILSGAEYLPGQTIADRFAITSQLLRGSDPLLVYLYVDELDRAAHRYGWQSERWTRRLEQLDDAVDDLLRSLPANVGVVMTADHGIVDVARERQIMLDADPAMLQGIREFGGEPRMRSIYLDDPGEAEAVANRFSTYLGKKAWVGTRDEAIANNWYGNTDRAVAQRLGEVIVTARGQYAFSLSSDSASALEMIGQHGGISDEERGVPLAVGGVLVGTGFAAGVATTAQSIMNHR